MQGFDSPRALHRPILPKKRLFCGLSATGVVKFPNFCFFATLSCAMLATSTAIGQIRDPATHTQKCNSRHRRGASYRRKGADDAAARARQYRRSEERRVGRE